MSPPDLVQIADEALYRAKAKQGKGHVVVQAPEVDAAPDD